MQIHMGSGFETLKQAKNAKFNCCAAIYSDLPLFKLALSMVIAVLCTETGPVQLCNDAPHVGQAGIQPWVKSSTHYLSFECFEH